MHGTTDVVRLNTPEPFHGDEYLIILLANEVIHMVLEMHIRRQAIFFIDMVTMEV